MGEVRAPPPSPPSSERLECWKEIAAYLKRDVRTVQRWEKHEAMPVHRHVHERLGTVYAYKSEIDAWWNNRRPRLEQQEQVSKVTQPRLWWAVTLVAAVAGLLVGYFVWQSFRPQAKPAVRKIMLVVLPFENLSGDPEQEYFSDGLTEEMITELARLQPGRLCVIARTSAMTYKSAKKRADQIGKELGVDYILEGSVRREADKVRVTAQLIQVRDQTNLWVGSYEHDLASVFAIQQDVARRIAGSLVPELLPGQQAAPARVSNTYTLAHESYLKGNYHRYRATVPSIEKAIEYYQEAIKQDPDYALAYAALARSQIFRVGARPRVALQQAKVAAVKALELNQALPEAHLALAMVKLYSDWDWPGAEREFQRALALDSGNAEAHFYYSHCLAATARLDEAITQARRAQELDPFSPLIGHYLGRLYYFSRQYDQAIAEYRKTLELDMNYAWTHLFLAVAYQKKGIYGEAVTHRQKYWSLMGVKPEDVTELGGLYSASGYTSVLRRWVKWVEGFSQRQGYVTSGELALIYAQLEEKEQAFKWLEKAYQDHTRDLIYLKVDPGYDSLRADSRFHDLLRRIGFPP